MWIRYGLFYSMATVCACSLAMLDAGVPLKSNIAGVAMGMIFGEKKEDPPIILTDILGLEDALGKRTFYYFLAT